MDIEVIKFLLKGIVHLSTFRLIVKEIPQESSCKGFIEFPPEFLLDKLSEINRNFVKTKISGSKHKSCNYYLIPHNIYSEMKNDKTNEKISHESFDVLKNYFSIMKLKGMKQKGNIEITISSREQVIDIPLPISVMDLEDKIVRQYGDAFLVFTYEQDQEKFPIFYSELLFKQLELFPNGKILKIMDRRQTVSKKSDRRGVKNRFLVSYKEETNFLKAYDNSYNNIYKFVDDKKLLEQLKSNHQEFEDYKDSDIYWKTLKK